MSPASARCSVHVASRDRKHGRSIPAPIQRPPWPGLLTSRKVRRQFPCTSPNGFVSGGMKRDGRSFDHRTLEAIRLMAVERVRDGEPASSVIASYGFSRTTIYKWVAAAATPGVGLKALLSRRATGRPRTLSPRQEQQGFRWIHGRDPRQYGLGFGLLTRSVVAILI